MASNGFLPMFNVQMFYEMKCCHGVYMKGENDTSSQFPEVNLRYVVLKCVFFFAQ